MNSSWPCRRQISNNRSRVSPAGRVPVLLVGETAIWDSLAIAEYLAELEPGLWPTSLLIGPGARHQCRDAFRISGAASADADECACGGTYRAFHSALEADIARIVDIWESCRREHSRQGPWLFGRWSIADAMYAPVVRVFAPMACRCRCWRPSIW